MSRTRLSTKGQLIIPLEVRERHGWTAGTELEVADAGDGVVIRPVAATRSTTPRDVIGRLRFRGRPKTLAEMEAAIAAAAAESR